MKKCKLILILFFFIGGNVLFAQQTLLDSLLHQVENKSISDSARVEYYINLCWELKNRDTKAAEQYALKGIALAKKIKFKIGEANCINNLAVIYNIRGDYDISIKYLLESLALKEKLLESGYHNPKGLKKSISTTLNNLGNALRVQKDYKKATHYLEKSIALKIEIGERKSLAAGYTNVGSLYLAQGDTSTAIIYQHKALAIAKEFNLQDQLAMAYNNLGNSLDRKSTYDSSLYYFKRSIEIKETLQDKLSLANTLNNIAAVYLAKKDYENALSHVLRSMEINESAGSKPNLKNNYIILSNLYAEMGQNDLAYKYMIKLDRIKDTLYNIDLSKNINEMSTRFETEKKEREITILQKEKRISEIESQKRSNELVLLNKEKELQEFTIKNNEKEVQLLKKDNELKEIENEKKEKQLEINEKEKKLKEAELSRERFIRNIFIGGIVVLILFSFVIINRFRITKKQKYIIELQKQVVEEKQKEIVDSITYAKRIQTAILPPLRLIQGILPDSFVLYKPKDIVAGDFYWMHTANESEDLILFAAADCTGHGVPGAMVSVVCHNALNRSVREYGILDPGKVLDKTREIVIHEFEKGEGLTSFTKSSEDSIKDGMDIALISLSPNTKKLKYAGANNPLWIIRNQEVIEIKADKQPIGKYVNAKPFTTHEIQLQSGDAVYFFTDGYADQFGGEQGKKFKGSKMKELLLSLSHKKMKNQKEELNTAFENWRGKLEQIDDVCVIGVRI